MIYNIEVLQPPRKKTYADVNAYFPTVAWICPKSVHRSNSVGHAKGRSASGGESDTEITPRIASGDLLQCQSAAKPRMYNLPTHHLMGYVLYDMAIPKIVEILRFRIVINENRYPC